MLGSVASWLGYPDVMLIVILAISGDLIRDSYITKEVCPGAEYFNNVGVIDELFSPKDKLELLRKFQIEPNRIFKYNTYVLSILAGSIIGLFCGGYFIYRLIKFGRFGVRSNIYFLLIATPIFWISTSISTAYTDLSINFHNSDIMSCCFLVAIVWIFIIYPALFVNAKKRGGLYSVLFPRNTSAN